MWVKSIVSAYKEELITCAGRQNPENSGKFLLLRILQLKQEVLAYMPAVSYFLYSQFLRHFRSSFSETFQPASHCTCMDHRDQTPKQVSGCWESNEYISPMQLVSISPKSQSGIGARGVGSTFPMQRISAQTLSKLAPCGNDPQNLT